MTSLALLEHTATTAPAFNSNFYITAATVIPVLFVAIAVLGPTYRNTLRRAVLDCKFWFTHPLPAFAPVPLPPEVSDYPFWNAIFKAAIVLLAITYKAVIAVYRILAAVTLALVLAFGIATIAAGGYGELLAIYALYQQHDQATTRHVVLIATMFLVILVVAGPMVAYLIGAFRREKAAQAPAEPQQVARGHSAQPIATPQPEPGKTDT